MSRRGSKRLYVPAERISDDDENDDQPLGSIRKAPKRGQAGEPPSVFAAAAAAEKAKAEAEVTRAEVAKAEAEAEASKPEAEAEAAKVAKAKAEAEAEAAKVEADEVAELRQLTPAQLVEVQAAAKAKEPNGEAKAIEYAIAASLITSQAEERARAAVEVEAAPPAVPTAPSAETAAVAAGVPDPSASPAAAAPAAAVPAEERAHAAAEAEEAPPAMPAAPLAETAAAAAAVAPSAEAAAAAAKTDGVLCKHGKGNTTDSECERWIRGSLGLGAQANPDRDQTRPRRLALT